MLKRILLLAAILLLVSISLMAKTPDPTAFVAKVGERSYNYKSFNDGFKAYLQYHVKGKTLTQQDSVKYNNQYWEELVGIYVYDQAIKSGKITVSNAELEAEIKLHVPEGVKQIPDFLTNGKFDQKKYEKGLKDHPDFKKEVMDYTRDLYSYNKLLKAIKNEVTVYPDSIKAAWMHQQNRAEATIIHFDPAKLTKITATEDEALAYYNEHKADYRRENGKGYLFARFQGAISKADNAEETAKTNKAKSYQLFTRAKEVGLAKAAAEQNITLEETPMFNGTEEIIPFIGRAPALIAYAYSNPLGSMPDIFYAPTGDIFVLELNREAAEYYISYEIRKQEVAIRANRAKRMYHMSQYVQNFLTTETPDTYLAAAARDSLAIITADNVLSDNELKPLGNISALNQAILATPEGSFTQIIEKDKVWYLAKVNKRYTPDLAEWEKNKKAILENATKELQTEHLNKWYLEQRAKLEIVDKRHEYYPILQPIKLQGK